VKKRLEQSVGVNGGFKKPSSTKRKPKSGKRGGGTGSGWDFLRAGRKEKTGPLRGAKKK